MSDHRGIEEFLFVDIKVLYLYKDHVVGARRNVRFARMRSLPKLPAATKD